MASVFKPTRPFKLPVDAILVESEGKPHVHLTERGRSVYYPLTKDGAKYLRPAKRWYVEYRDHNGYLRREKGFTDKKATEALATELERTAERKRVGLIDPAVE